MSDPLDFLEERGVSIAWVRDMLHSALYLAGDHIMILNSQCPREELGEAVTELLWPSH
jgi:hypothetical protein